METNNKISTMHPLTAAAAIAVILACLTGIAAMLGILPNFNKNTPPVTAINTAPTEPVVPAPIATTPAAPNTTPPVAITETAPIVTTPPPAVKPKPKPKKAPTKPTNTAQAETLKEQANVPPSAPPPPPCPNCGIVESVQAIQQQAPATGLGAGVGALLGGVLGHQFGGGNGRTLATVAGAIGGGFAGNAVEKNTHQSVSYEVIVRMEDGYRQRFIMNVQRWRSGDLVRVDNGNLLAR